MQKEDLTGWGVWIESNRGTVDIFEKKVNSPFLENSHWLKGNKNVITLTTADHDCVQARFDSWSGLFLNRILSREISSLKDEQVEES